jgi:hypothetical protein
MLIPGPDDALCATVKVAVDNLNKEKRGDDKCEYCSGDTYNYMPLHFWRHGDVSRLDL